MYESLRRIPIRFLPREFFFIVVVIREQNLHNTGRLADYIFLVIQTKHFIHTIIMLVREIRILYIFIRKLLYNIFDDNRLLLYNIY